MREQHAFPGASLATGRAGLAWAPLVCIAAVRCSRRNGSPRRRACTRLHRESDLPQTRFTAGRAAGPPRTRAARRPCRAAAPRAARAARQTWPAARPAALGLQPAAAPRPPLAPNSLATAVLVGATPCRGRLARTNLCLRPVRCMPRVDYLEPACRRSRWESQWEQAAHWCRHRRGTCSTFRATERPRPCLRRTAATGPPCLATRAACARVGCNHHTRRRRLAWAGLRRDAWHRASSKAGARTAR